MDLSGGDPFTFQPNHSCRCKRDWTKKTSCPRTQSTAPSRAALRWRNGKSCLWPTNRTSYFAVRMWQRYVVSRCTETGHDVAAVRDTWDGGLSSRPRSQSMCQHTALRIDGREAQHEETPKTRIHDRSLRAVQCAATKRAMRTAAVQGLLRGSQSVRETGEVRDATARPAERERTRRAGQREGAIKKTVR